MVLDIPVPPSLNKSRKIDWANYPGVEAWRSHCDKHLMANGQYRKARAVKPAGRYEIQIVLDERQTGMDLGNVEKLAQDYLKRIELIVDDGPKFCRRIVIEFGTAPDGCRLIIKPMGTA
jgi:hypothetical protein